MTAANDLAVRRALRGHAGVEYQYDEERWRPWRWSTETETRQELGAIDANSDGGELSRLP